MTDHVRLSRDELIADVQQLSNDRADKDAEINRLQNGHRFRVLNTFRRGVVLVSVPENLVLHLMPGDEITISEYPPGALLDTSFGADARMRAAREIPEDPAPDLDWRHTMSPRRGVIQDL